MIVDRSYQAVTGRMAQIIENAMGVDYKKYESGSIAFDYEAMMNDTGYSLEDIIRIQRTFNVGNTPIFELRNLTALARKCAGPGKGARIFIKDEAANPAGSFKERRAATSVYHAKKMGYKGVIAATSGNYGAAVASQAAMQGLKCLIVQECYDSHGIGQPEIIEKARKCEALGAEVLQLTVGPELFYETLMMLEDTGYFNASLYSAFGVSGVETLGWELGHQFLEQCGRHPDVVVCANAGGGNLTGTARGLRKAGCPAKVVAASVDLKGLHMASDVQFNKKSFTTAHTGFGVPYATDPDHSDVPRSAARPLRYMDRYVTVKQGEVFYITEALATLEGMEKGPAGNTSLAAAFSLAQEMDEDQIIVAQETEYTGAGKHIQPQLSFARKNGIELLFGDPSEEVPGKNIIFPARPELLKARDSDLAHMRRSLIRRQIRGAAALCDADLDYLAAETNTDRAWVEKTIEDIRREQNEAK
ncbi:MAG TPA: PLP-dependent lyase/thiolase [Candidatus Ventrousia excrementavium]|uniref:PLP-dependent lyase/thiolase n=1 Tax=Candidatus Ventrousia excrementavium TaxID=2840961 RepID=A0A9D1IV86_9CLOT|nr:PLP-dependent lyase/thiolase [Candidatus Ventrousia excrementavium]